MAIGSSYEKTINRLTRRLTPVYWTTVGRTADGEQDIIACTEEQGADGQQNVVIHTTSVMNLYHLYGFHVDQSTREASAAGVVHVLHCAAGPFLVRRKLYVALLRQKKCSPRPKPPSIRAYCCCHFWVPLKKTPGASRIVDIWGFCPQKAPRKKSMTSGIDRKSSEPFQHCVARERAVCCIARQPLTNKAKHYCRS